MLTLLLTAEGLLHLRVSYIVFKDIDLVSSIKIGIEKNPKVLLINEEVANTLKTSLAVFKFLIKEEEIVFYSLSPDRFQSHCLYLDENGCEFVCYSEINNIDITIYLRVIPPKYNVSHAYKVG